MGYLGATLTQVFTRTGGTDESLRDVTKAQMWNEVRECGWRHAPEAREGFWEIWKRQLVELSLAVRRRKVTFACSPRPWAGVALDGVGVKWKSQNRKNVYLSPYAEEPLNSKVINSFVPEFVSVFRVSRFLCSMYKCYEYFMYVSRSHI